MGGIVLTMYDSKAMPILKCTWFFRKTNYLPRCYQPKANRGYTGGTLANYEGLASIHLVLYEI